MEATGDSSEQLAKMPQQSALMKNRTGYLSEEAIVTLQRGKFSVRAVCTFGRVRAAEFANRVL